ncbi:polymer-forming cytoskeletal protein [Wukongibacter baidiensis]|uniref:bactofilin family protein n=1 Tax=Wukongibacter baidiensis TaxID=1723361 RepID=UPI003D7F2EC3
MFKKTNGVVSPQGFDTLIGSNAAFDGSLKTSGLLRIDGIFNGDIEVDGDIVVGEDGKIIGNVKTSNIEICGLVEGNVIASNQLKISSSGRLFGDIEVSSFIVEEKAIFDGKCKMKNDVVKGMEVIKGSKGEQQAQ